MASTGGHCDNCKEDHPQAVNVCPKQEKFSEGVKFDAGKARFSLLPWDAIREVAIVFTIGGV